MPYTEAQKAATLKYAKKTYKRIPFDMRKEEYEELKQYCDAHGLSVNGFIRDLIKQEIKKSRE